MGNPSRWKRIKVWFWTRLARRLPRSLVYFTLVRVEAEVNKYDWSVLTVDEHVAPVAASTVISQWHAVCTWPKDLLEMEDVSIGQ